MSRLSGPEWCAEFPTSVSVDDLAEPLRESVKRFIDALQAAGAKVDIAATYRPPERAYLMHYAAMIAKAGQDPVAIPAIAGVDIDWVHRDAQGNMDVAATRFAAQQMVTGYGIEYPPALISRHTQRLAIDMDIAWDSDVLRVKDGRGNPVTISVVPKDGAHNWAVHQLGKTYGVIKLLSDPPHWSSDGH